MIGKIIKVYPKTLFDTINRSGTGIITKVRAKKEIF